MIASKAFLKGIAAELILASGLGAGLPARAQQAAPVAAPRTFSLIDPLSVRGPVAPGDALKKFERAAGFGHPSFTANAAELVALGFRGWPVAGVHSDPDLLLQTPVDFSATVLPGRPGASIAGSPLFPPQARNPFSTAYGVAKEKLFKPSEIQATLPPPNQELAADTLFSSRLAVRAMILERDRIESLLFPVTAKTVGASKEFGHGPALDAVLSVGETKEQTAARQEILENRALGHFSQEAAEMTPLLQAEIEVSLHDLLSRAISTGTWKRVPETREELAAAVYNAVDAGRPAGTPPEAIDTFLATPRGQALRAEFPAPPLENFLLKATFSMLPKNRASLYDKVLPDAYGDLLELYGDADGRTRLGLETGKPHAVSFAFHLLHAGEGEPQTLTPDAWRHLASKAEPEAFETLCRLAVRHRQPEALGALLATAGQPGHALTPEQKAVLLDGAIAISLQSSDANELAGRRIVLQLLDAGADLEKLPPPAVQQPPLENLPRGEQEEERPDPRFRLYQIRLTPDAFRRAPAQAPAHDAAVALAK